MSGDGLRLRGVDEVAERLARLRVEEIEVEAPTGGTLRDLEPDFVATGVELDGNLLLAGRGAVAAVIGVDHFAVEPAFAAVIRADGEERFLRAQRFDER